MAVLRKKGRMKSSWSRRWGVDSTLWRMLYYLLLNNQDGLYASMAMFDVRRNGAEVKKYKRSRMGEMILELYHILLQNQSH